MHALDTHESDRISPPARTSRCVELDETAMAAVGNLIHIGSSVPKRLCPRGHTRALLDAECSPRLALLLLLHTYKYRRWYGG